VFHTCNSSLRKKVIWMMLLELEEAHRARVRSDLAKFSELASVFTSRGALLRLKRERVQ